MSHADDRLTAALAAIANVGLDALPPVRLGDVELRDDQRRIVARAQRALDQSGGCLIAEAVGRGKTYVALALAKRWERPLVVVAGVAAFYLVYGTGTGRPALRDHLARVAEPREVVVPSGAR